MVVKVGSTVSGLERSIQQRTNYFASGKYISAHPYPPHPDIYGERCIIVHISNPKVQVLVKSGTFSSLVFFSSSVLN